MMTNYVFVLDTNRQPLAPCHPARARELLRKGKAAVFRRQPFTIILKHVPEGPIKTDLKLGIDPGSKTTGLAILVPGKTGTQCVIGINLIHRGQVIKQRLQERAMYRRARRHRKTRYRQARFLNRAKPKGWLPPSIQHRVLTTRTWVDRLMRWSTISSANIEEVKFDIQKLKNPEIKGKGYQQGKLFGTELREYLLTTYNHTCQYCLGASKDPILQWDHIVPRSRGGSDSVDNATLTCKRCNQAKGSKTLPEFYASFAGVKGPWAQAIRTQLPKVMKRKRHPPLRDAAVMNAIRYRLRDYCTALGLNPQMSPGWVTKRARIDQGYPKEHWVDAACVGGHPVKIPAPLRGLEVKAMGHGRRQMVRPNKYGFPSGKPKGSSRVFGFKTGDLVEVYILEGRYKGYHAGRVAVNSKGSFFINKTPVYYKHCHHLQHNDGYRHQPIIRVQRQTVEINPFIPPPYPYRVLDKQPKGDKFYSYSIQY